MSEHSDESLEQIEPMPAVDQVEPPASDAPPSVPMGKFEERPHPLTPLAKAWIGLAAVSYFVLREFLEQGTVRPTGRMGIVILVLVGVRTLLTMVGGYFQWRFTRFVIDDEELRIEHRFIQHRSDKVRFDRIQAVDVHQPMLARVLGLAALRIDVGGMGQAKSIEFLARSRAYEMRDYLLARAHGQAITVAESAQREVGDAFTEVAGDDQVLIKVHPKNLIIAALTSSDFLITLLIFLFITVGLVIALPGAGRIGAVVGIVPMALSLWQTIWSRVINDWNFTLSRTGRGVRISKGLTSISSQSLPIDRIQAVRISQSLLWRPLGLYRVTINVLGFIGASESNDAPTSVMLPAGSRDEVDVALRTIWPGFDLASVELQGVPGTVRWLHPFIFNTYKWGLDDFAVVTAKGALIHQTTVTPHEKLQSVHLDQGPLQRRLGLADAHFDIPTGAIMRATSANMAAADARWLVLTAPQRARDAREAAADRTWLDALPTPTLETPPMAAPPPKTPIWTPPAPDLPPPATPPQTEDAGRWPEERPAP